MSGAQTAKQLLTTTVMSSPPASVSADLTAQAALARVTLGSGEVSEDVRFAMERDERQALRRLVDPGIIRNNDKSTAHASIDVSIST